jgi:outer membrane receptor for monomeric catechols
MNDGVGCDLYDPLDARYQFALPNTKGLSVQLNISNLFDEQYFNTISSTNYSVALPGFTGSGPAANLGIARRVPRA